jgi:hypothetical protein
MKEYYTYRDHGFMDLQYSLDHIILNGTLVGKSSIANNATPTIDFAITPTIAHVHDPFAGMFSRYTTPSLHCMY